MWIDSDVLFRPEHIVGLVNQNVDIVSGLYLMEGGKYFAVVKDWDEEFFKKNGYFQFLTQKDIKDNEELVEVTYTGMGFVLIKKGVFEALEYPWFEPKRQEIGEMCDFSSEDVGFCLKAREKGFKIIVDPKIIVKHEKKIVL